MGTAFSGLLKGYTDTATALQQYDDQQAARQAQIDLAKETLKLHQTALKGQEAHLQLQDQVVQANLTKQIKTQQAGEQLAALLGQGKDLDDPATRQQILQTAAATGDPQHVVTLADLFGQRDQQKALQQLQRGFLPAGSTTPTAPAAGTTAAPASVAPAPQGSPSPSSAQSTVTPLPQLSPAFQEQLQASAQRLKMDPNHLLQSMNFETAGTFNPAIQNGAGSGATGLIGFMPTTAQALGTTTADLAKMTAEQQLQYVEKYLTPYAGKLGSLQDAYMAILSPSAIGKSPDTVLFKAGTRAYLQNAGLDTDRKGYVTVGDATQHVADYAQRTGLPTFGAPSPPAGPLVADASGQTTPPPAPTATSTPPSTPSAPPLFPPAAPQAPGSTPAPTAPAPQSAEGLRLKGLELQRDELQGRLDLLVNARPRFTGKTGELVDKNITDLRQNLQLLETQIQNTRQNSGEVEGAKVAAKLTTEQRLKQANVDAGIQEATDLLAGRKDPGALSVDQAALTALRKHGIDLKDYPELQQRIQAQAPLKAAERTNYVDPATYTTPAVRTQAEADQRGLVQLPKEDAQSMRQGNVLYAKLNRAQETLAHLVETDPRFAALKDTTGLTERAKELAIVAVIKANQDNPLVRQLQSDLQEMAISYGIFVSGLKGRPASQILDRTTEGLPSLDQQLFKPTGGGNYLETILRLVSSTKLPDLPRTITAQLELMKDVVRSVQEGTLESSGALTPEESSARRSARLQRVQQLAPPPQDLAAQAAASPPAETAAQIPGAPYVRSPFGQ